VDKAQQISWWGFPIAMDIRTWRLRQGFSHGEQSINGKLAVFAEFAQFVRSTLRDLSPKQF
jgi:hypothetical protein